ncbi:MAG: small-conductance mechanosensitive channel [Myxococcota bacterium]|jgi:small-conductance mechanosensitive channel
MDWDAFWTDAWPWSWPTIVLLCWLLLGAFVVRRFLAFLARRAERTQNDYDDHLIPLLKRPLHLALLIVGLSVWIKLAPLSKEVEDGVLLVTKASISLIILLLVDAAIQTWMIVREKTSSVLQTSGKVLRAFARVVVYLVGGLMVLSTIGIDVTPIIASLGVGSLAVGLALQSTMQDFISGLLIAADQPIRVGEYVEIEALAGTVMSIGWRSTRIRTRDNMFVIIPNSQLATNKLINRSRPDASVEFKTPVGVGYESDLRHVERILNEVAREVHDSHPSAVKAYAPVAATASFGGSSVDFYVWCKAKHWLQYPALLDAMIHAIHVRFNAEGINIPFPIRTLDIPMASPLLGLTGFGQPAPAAAPTAQGKPDAG